MDETPGAIIPLTSTPEGVPPAEAVAVEPEAEAEPEVEPSYDDIEGMVRGENPGLTTFPNDKDREQRRRHKGCLLLEEQGRVTRFLEAVRASDGLAFIIWMPVA
jgi:hypothetical protein